MHLRGRSYCKFVLVLKERCDTKQVAGSVKVTTCKDTMIIDSELEVQRYKCFDFKLMLQFFYGTVATQLKAVATYVCGPNF